ncbi:hypothetical protein IWQ62_005489 [Dispira parvispora]|uniref:Uncharacterized protein n=1 Tax=Dispira parvispora TaxID=1520584 RepID=A0A9W8DZL1_9FUNG|nr:hypothetical protein IWQ62_005489 [Dispira parvispora]
MELRQENTLLKLKLHAFNQPQSRETASREANIHASNDKRLLTRAFIHQDKQYWKYQLWKVDDMNPLDCKHLIKEFMLLFKVNDPRHLIAWLSLRRLRAAERRTRPA